MSQRRLNGRFSDNRILNRNGALNLSLLLSQNQRHVKPYRFLFCDTKGFRIDEPAEDRPTGGRGRLFGDVLGTKET